MKSPRTSQILVSKWATMVYGEFAPTPYALRCWIDQGKIDPAPQKMRGKWFVHPTARYRDLASDPASSAPHADYS